MNGHMSSLYSWQDSTSQFLEACDQLELGELLHDEMFGLFEAMSAIEMMDPKMDAGMLCTEPLVLRSRGSRVWTVDTCVWRVWLETWTRVTCRASLIRVSRVWSRGWRVTAWLRQ